MILVLVAILILIIALVNFINISTSNGCEQIKQTGVMKVVGATQSIIFRNITGEAFLLFLTSLSWHLELVNALINFIRSYTGIHFNQKITNSPGFILVSMGSIFGSESDFQYRSSHKNIFLPCRRYLKKNIGSKTSWFSMKGVLVTTQFTIAIVLIAFTLLVRKQVNFGCTSLGFNQDNIIGIKLTQQLSQKKDVLKNMLLEKPELRTFHLLNIFPVKLFHNGEKT